MTNREIIMREVILRGITEEIHTFQRWKDMGFIVKKGEKSSIKFPIWKYSKARVNKETGEEIKEYAFMKLSAFFTASQVEKL